MAKTTGNILIIDDDEYIQLSAKLLLDQYYTKVTTLSDPLECEAALKSEHYEVVILDMNFEQGETSGKAGLHWLKQIHSNHPNSAILLMTAYGDINLAVDAMKEGAVDFILKPWHNEKLVSTVQMAFNLAKQQQKVQKLEVRQKIMTSDMDDQFHMIGKSKGMKTVFKTIQKIAPTDADVLILGENGTGKEVVARSIHKQSSRSAEAFIKVDLGSISESLFESELFGHKKGAFTDAKEDRIGRFEAASGGTIFLDEIGNLSMPLQAKLLTVIQHRLITRVGANQSIPVDIRIICATNSNLSGMVKENTFREDLFFRINTLEITVPPLKNRPEDIPLLASHFSEKYAHKYGKQGVVLSESAFNKLISNSWPGNVRELQHAVERAVIMSDGNDLTSKDFHFISPPHDKGQATDFDSYDLEVIEAWAIAKAIKKHNGNISKAAKELGLSRGAMYRRMEKYGI